MARRLLITKLYLAVIITAGVGASVYPLLHWHCQQPGRTICYLALALVAAGLKISIPAVTGTLSVGFLFPLVGIVELGLPEALLMGWSHDSPAMRLACPRSRQRYPARLQSLQYFLHHHAGLLRLSRRLLGASGRAGTVRAAHRGDRVLLSNTSMVSIVIGLTDGQDPLKVWREGYSWSFTYYLVGAALTGLLHAANRYFEWPTAMLLGPVVFAIHYAYQAHRDRIEGSAAACGGSRCAAAPDGRNAGPGRRSQGLHHPRSPAARPVYALAIGRELGLSRHGTGSVASGGAAARRRQDRGAGMRSSPNPAN